MSFSRRGMPPAPPRPGRPRDDAATLRRILGIFRPYRFLVVFIVLVIAVNSVLGLINPLLLKAIIDDAIGGQNFFLLNIFVLAMIVVPIITGLIGVGQTYLSNIVGQRVMRDIRLALYARLQSMPLRFFTGTRTGEIQSRLSNDVGGIQSVVTDTAGSVVSNVTTVLSTVVAMLILSPTLTLMSLGLAPLFVLITRRIGNARREITAERQKSLADMSAMVEETLSVSGVLLTKTYGRQDAEVERFRKENERLLGLQIRATMVGRWFNMALGVIFSILPAFVYWIAGNDIINGAGTLTIGDVVAFTTLQTRIYFPIGSLLNLQVEIQSALALFDRIFEYLDLKPDVTDKPGALALQPPTTRGEVAFQDVGFSYDPASTRPTLDGISFTAAPGQLVALVGPSGAGKTTITYLLPRLYDVTSGAVRIDGHDVRDVTLQSLGQVVGVVTQETYLFHTTIRDNLLYARADATEAEMMDAARAAAIHDRIMELPDGYDTTVGERGYKLSGGEKQRLALARVILKDPRILILDEATSALDTTSERLIQSALDRVMQGRTTIAIAHRLSTILAADQILVIEAGRIVERGTHATLLAAGGLYARLYQEQFLLESGGAGDAPELVASPS